MFGYFLNLAYLALLVVASPWLIVQAIRKGKYREGFTAKFLGVVPRRSSDRPCAWFHAVSVGEVNLLKPLLAEFARRHPDWDCVLSTTTMTGFALARTRYPELTVFYCPLDFTWSTRAAMRRVRPSLLVLAELELWPNLVSAAKRAGARVAIVNGRLGERSFRGYRRLRPIVARVLAKFDLIAAQTDEYAARFRALGATPAAVHVTGSVKFDGAQTDRRNPATLRLAALAGFAAGDLVFLAGSTQEPEEQLALETFLALEPDHPQLRLVIVPRHPDRFAAVAAMIERVALCDGGFQWQKRSDLEAHGADPATRVLLVDRVGELGVWWGTASVAFVGGSLGRRGGQNMIEPAAYGAAVAFGPNTHNFRDIVAALLDADAAMIVPDGAALTAFVRRALDDPAFAALLGARARQVVAQNLGATDRTLSLLESLLAPPLPAIHAPHGLRGQTVSPRLRDSA